MATILIVDDNAANRDLLVTLSRYLGHRPIEAADGAEALALVRREDPDLVISDILMPNMDGYEFVRQLRADPEHAATNVIFYTAHYHEREARKLAQACGVFRVLTKPSEPADIIAAIDDALAHRPSRAAAPEPVAPEFDRTHLRLMTDKLAANVAQLQAANHRLAALTDLNLRLASERDPRMLLDRVCRGARELLGSKYSLLATCGEAAGPPALFTAGGLEAAESLGPAGPDLSQPIFDPLRDLRCVRIHNPGGDPAAVGLPPAYPPCTSILVAPVASLTTLYGAVFLLEKLGAIEFDEEDEKILVILGAQTGRIYENSRLTTHLERRVAERTAELQGANEELAAFDYSVSHDLRAPLGRIQGFSAVLLDEYAAHLDERGRHYISRIAHASAEMEQLVTDLLSLSLVTRADLDRTQVDLRDAVLEIFSELRRSEPSRAVETRVEPGMTAWADRGLVRALLQNLLGNAWKFTGRTAAPRIEVGTERAGGVPTFFVRDNGAGFDGTRAAELFKPFKRFHSQSEFPGTGIGLATVQRIVGRHGGRVWARSAVGEGTIIYFTLEAQRDPGR